MKKTAEQQTAGMQKGFRPGVGTRDQIYNLRMIMEKAREASMPLYLAFIDYKKAFDTVRHTKLREILKGMGLEKSTENVIRNLYKQQQAAMRVELEVIDWFKIGKGLHQGCSLSPLSFNCYTELSCGNQPQGCVL